MLQTAVQNKIIGENDLQFHMDAYDRCTNVGKKILPIVLQSMVEAENFPGHPRTPVNHKCYTVGLYKGAEAAVLQIYSYQIFALEIFVPQV
jgi:hypothetical protein